MIDSKLKIPLGYKHPTALRPQPNLAVGAPLRDTSVSKLESGSIDVIALKQLQNRLGPTKYENLQSILSRSAN